MIGKLKQIKTASVLCVIAAALVLIMGFAVKPAYADTSGPVKYVDENGTEHQVNDYIVLDGTEKEIGGAGETWYVAKTNLTYSKNLKVKDNAKVNLILCDGIKMACKDNFTVNESSELKIWGQKEKGGSLRSEGGHFSGYAAIGGATGHTNGLIEIHSGEVTAQLGGSTVLNKGAAIGAGNGADGGKIYIYGGKVLGYCDGAGTGIGGGHKGAAGDIRISGGEVKGASDGDGAGIGSGDEVKDNSKSSILISGGTVEAESNIGAGIGGGDHTPGGTITITGGTINAIANDGMFEDAGAGIGGGNGANAGVINILGGNITAKSGTGAGAAIGCGEDCEGETTGEIYIKGGVVKATAGNSSESAGIGGGNGANGCHVVITGGNVTATGCGSFTTVLSNNGGAGIGGGDDGNGGITEIYGGYVSTIGGGDGAGIGGGDNGSGGTVIIGGGEVYAYGFTGGAGIGGGEGKSGGDVTISGGTVTATGGAHLSVSGAGIGGGDSASGTTKDTKIHITGGTVKATGGNESAGIGGGDDGGAANVVIDGGTVTATGGKYAAGIGTGQKPADDRKNDGSLVINGGTVTAKGGTDGAGIGGGENADGIKVTINGGVVNAEGVSYGAGIGGGENCKGGDLTINGGTVTAIAGDDCNCSDTNGGSAIGSGQGIKKDSDDVFGKFTLAESMMVVAGSKKDNADKVPVADRKNKVNNRNYAEVRACTHEGATTFDKDADGHKIQGCPYCGLDQNEKKAHVYSEGKCTVCGYDQPRDITVSFDKGDHGTGEMTPYEAYNGEKYVLPKCDFDPEDGYAFSGWNVDNKIKKKGDSIDVTENTTVTAVWKDAGTDAWRDLEKKIENGGSIKLENDIVAPKNVEVLSVEKGKSVTLDLNGYSIDMRHRSGAVLAVGGSGTGNLTVKNGTLTSGTTGIILNEKSTLLIQDCTITDNYWNDRGYAITMHMDEYFGGGGYLSVAGKVDLSGNKTGGVLLARNRTINIADTLSKDSVIPVKLAETPTETGGEDPGLPTYEKPVVITSGLKGKGDAECFSCVNESYMIGTNTDGEVIFGVPTTITFDKGDGIEDEGHSMADVTAACGGVYTLPKSGFKDPEGYEFKGWKINGTGDALPAGATVKVTKDMKLVATYNEPVKITLEVGEGHDTIAQDIADAFNESKEGSAVKRPGEASIKIQMREDMTITEVEDKICTMMRKADIRYDGMAGQARKKWTETVGLRQLSEYSSLDEHEEAEMQNTPGHGGNPIGEIYETGRVFYVHWYTPVTAVEMTVDEPVCGTEIKVDDEGVQDVTPEFTLTSVEPSDQAIGSGGIQSVLKSASGKGIFKGTITGEETYVAGAYITPAFGYYIPEDIDIKVNGERLDAEDSSISGGILELNKKVVAHHAHEEGAAPVWTWNGHSSATASLACTADPSHVAEVTTDDLFVKTVSEATHTSEGKINYTATVVLDGVTYTNFITRIIPKTDHVWGEPEYTWFEDNSHVLAKRHCTLDPSHVDTEVAETTASEGRAATCTEPGTTMYTASFENEAFSAQTTEAEDVPALGHDWGEWEVTTPATEKEDGVETRTCKRCKDATETRVIPHGEHVHGLVHVDAKEPTCTEEGNDEYWVCEDGDFPCHRIYADEAATQSFDDIPTIPAKGHDYRIDWSWEDLSSATLTYVCKNDPTDRDKITVEPDIEVTAATCEKAGKKVYIATVADGPGGKPYTDVREEEIPASGHSYGQWEYLDEDFHQRVCANDSSHVEKQGHDWDEGVVIKEPTTENEGSTRFTCETCGATKTEAIPKIIPDDPIALTEDMITLSAESFVYNGKVQKPDVTVSYEGETIDPDYYTVTYSDENSTEAGTYTVTVRMKNGHGFDAVACKKNYTIKKAANTLNVKGKEAKVKFKKLKKKAQKLKATKVIKFRNAGQGAKKYTLVSAKKGSKNFKKKFKVNAKTGQVTVKKKLKKGTYKVRVKVLAAGDANHDASAVKTVTFKVRVR